MGLNSNQKKLLKCLKNVASEIGVRSKELTGLIGELSACEKLKKFNLEWEPSKGYDCIDRSGRSDNKFEVKTRRNTEGKAVRLGKFGKRGKYLFTYGLYVELDGNFDVKAIYKLPKEPIKKLEKKEKGGKGLPIRKFTKRAGDPVYSKQINRRK